MLMNLSFILDFFQDASDIAEFELQENFLNHIEADQLRRQDIYSPPSTPASAQTKAAYNHRHHSVSSHTEYPITPITSPGQNAMTGQWVSTQLQEQNAYAHPMDFLQHGDGVSQADTLDREVAAATANLTLSSPRQSPYYIKKKHSHTSSVSKKSVSKKDSHRALERLQTEVTALTEQIDRMRRQQKDETTFTKVVKVLLKHLMADSAIFLIAFYILWKRKSPLAYSLINAIMPFLQDIIRSIIRKVVFWKITV
ncbi:uncharacterized protein EV154DRAFT_495172 [Mucor mucedo]|uniref:uncharacterized protein n=1 Tax=Mucor mucedo TaxID=29922 RepID=UPI00221F1DFF|nr:uncharacterized protein EV154DRAFT_495172 [Mucor mucedo]KAI7895521.1 hypothetical protein EV154DRAFT_495172 [Mucor mucedo]